MNLEDALGCGSNQPGGDPVWPGGGNSNSNSIWPSPNPQPSAPGGWNNPQPPGPGGWNSPQPPGPGGWNSPQPSAPGGWNTPQPAGPGGWPPPAGPGGWPGPSPGPGPGPGPAIPVAPQRNLAVPYSQDLPHGVYDKLLITISGTIKHHPDKFIVDLYTRTGDLAFHLNPRFNENGRQVIVRNTCINKKWGKEERELPHFPFVQGQPFEMKILCTNAAFKVAVNNSHLLEYRHRITDLRSITRLNIYNDVTLSNVKMENTP